MAPQAPVAPLCRLPVGEVPARGASDTRCTLQLLPSVHFAAIHTRREARRRRRQNRIHTLPALLHLLQVAHVHVPKGQVLCCETLTAAELDAQLGGGGGGRGRPWLAPGLALLDSLLGALSTLGPGRYLLLHGAGDEACALLSALPAELEETAGGGAAPLPAAARLTSPSAVYDLHAGKLLASEVGGKHAC